MIDVLGWAIATIVVVITVMVHYEVMLNISDRLIPWAQRRFHGRRVMVAAIAALLLGHIVEIWIFALSMMVITHVPSLGALTGEFDGDLHAYVYFSAANYTSIGNGNIHPHGAIRSIIVSETLTGLMMIAWSASFAYLKMEQIWKTHRSGS